MEWNVTIQELEQPLQSISIVQLIQQFLNLSGRPNKTNIITVHPEFIFIEK